MYKYIDTIKELALLYILVLLLGTVTFSLSEGKSLWDSFYWAFITATSTGYGDITPQTIVGRITAFCLIHFNVLFLYPLIIIQLLNKVYQDRDEFTHEEQEELKGLLRQTIDGKQPDKEALDKSYKDGWAAGLEYAKRQDVNPFSV